MAKKKTKSRTKTVHRRSGTTKRVKTRRRSKKRGFLSEFSLSNPAMTGAVKSTFSGALGGITAGLVQRMMANQSPGMQIGGLALGSVIASWGLKAPNFGAGMAGACGMLIASEVGLLAEGNMENQQWANNIQRLPMFLNEEGNPMLSEDYQSGYGTPNGGWR